MDTRLKQLFIRSIAYGIDVVFLLLTIVMLPQFLLQLTGLHPLMNKPPDEISANELHLWVLATVTLPVFIYFATMFASRKGATAGMRMMKISVTDLNKQRLPFSKASVRAFVLLIPWELTHIAMFYPVPVYQADPGTFRYLFIVSGGLSFLYWLMPLTNAKGRSLHDFVAGTVILLNKIHRPKLANG